MKTPKLIEIISAILIVLFLYTGGQKIIEFDVFRIQLSRQPLPDWAISILTWILPLAELAAAGLLLFTHTRTAGLHLSAALMLSFTVYTALAYTEAFGYVPCACGRIFSSMGWGAHLLINSLLLILTLAVIFPLHNKSKKIMNTS
ncbi:methylamine utilization protein MauE [Anseongella ginsenosidimutans]|uniref:Methylamine utilization protein MauE n=1 Tax=Anseongella ginsenosidimutans TaxID=496056 RepID=A0A4R3KU01_9SPHI|nr:MauE/DoxX family redox-associated membrane protein [Anseongella ginsenosidimutans]QEC52895.1 hypothetical protein FRZ59_11490 [Anseongella ginsenosidimutans]TCS87285.1 methylamine utilization protein MauE [Anseongella ginsenosidimutans]